MDIIASPFAAARSNGPATRRLLLLLALLLVGLALSVRPGEVSAAPSNVQLITSGFNVWNNSVRITFDDTHTYPGNDCDGSYQYPHNGRTYTYTPGVFAYPTRIHSSCNARDITTSAINFGSGGSRRVNIRIVYDDYVSGTGGSSKLITPSAYSNSYTFPTAPNITSFSVSGTILTVNWDSHAHTGSDLDWWIIASASTSPSEAFASQMVAEDSPTARTGTLDLSSYDLTFGKPIYLWVAVTSGTPSASQAHYLYWSNGYQADLDTLEECTEEDVLDLGYLTGYDHSIQGSFLNAPCEVDAKTSHAFRFRLASARDVDATFTPATDYGAGAGSYEVAIRRNSLDGLLLESGSGAASFDVDTFNVAAGLDYYVTVSRSGVIGRDDWVLSLAYGHIAPPTPTPLPTPTPRIQPNQDFRLHPHPGGIAYTVDTVYQFEFEGISHVFPVTARSSNPAALELAVSPDVTCDTAAADEVQADSQSIVLYVKACTAGRNTTLSLVGSGGDFLAEYSIFVRGEGVPEPEPATIPQGLGADVTKRDELGLGIVLGVVCGGFGVGCDTDLIINILVTVAAVVVMGLLLKRSRGGATSMSVGVAAAFGVAVLMLGYLWVGFDLWLVVIVLLPILAVGGIAAVNKGRQAG